MNHPCEGQPLCSCTKFGPQHQLKDILPAILFLSCIITSHPSTGSLPLAYMHAVISPVASFPQSSVATALFTAILLSLYSKPPQKNCYNWLSTVLSSPFLPHPFQPGGLNPPTPPKLLLPTSPIISTSLFHSHSSGLILPEALFFFPNIVLWTFSKVQGKLKELCIEHIHRLHTKMKHFTIFTFHSPYHLYNNTLPFCSLFTGSMNLGHFLALEGWVTSSCTLKGQKLREGRGQGTVNSNGQI